MERTGTSHRFLVAPGSAVVLDRVDTRSTAGAPGDKAETEDASAALNGELANLQERLWAERRQSLLVVLQAMDAGGKDGTIKKVFRGVNPQGCRVESFKTPSDEERSHDFLWRIHKAAPAAGEIAIFNRSHYEDVLIVRVHELVPKEIWSSRFKLIKDFEENLDAAGTTIVKLFLHISKEEQAERFRKRLATPEKRWKFNLADLDERKHWDSYRAAFEEALTKTSTKAAPWYVIPADRKWYRDWAVLSVLVETMRRMDPQFPEADPGIVNVRVE